MTSAFIAAIIWYFPGFQAGELPVLDKEHLKISFSADQVVCKQWCASCATWEESTAQVNKASQSIVTEIQSLKPAERKDIVLVGHSLGGRVVAYSLARLGKIGINIRTAVLLAPAISSGDQYASKLHRGCSSIILVVGESDPVLKLFYPLVTNGESVIETIDNLDGETKYLKYVVPNQYLMTKNQLFPGHNASVCIEYLFLMRRSGDDANGRQDTSLANNLGLERSVDVALRALSDECTNILSDIEKIEKSTRSVEAKLQILVKQQGFDRRRK